MVAGRATVASMVAILDRTLRNRTPSLAGVGPRFYRRPARPFWLGVSAQAVAQAAAHNREQ